jgi:hypothetical protein
MELNTKIQTVHVKPDKNITSVAVLVVTVLMVIQVFLAMVAALGIDMAPSRPLFVEGNPLDILQIKGERLPE